MSQPNKIPTQIKDQINRIPGFQTIKPHLISFAITGSRSRNTHTETSDWDVIVVHNHPQQFRPTQTITNNLDLRIIHLKTWQKLISEGDRNLTNMLTNQQIINKNWEPFMTNITPSWTLLQNSTFRTIKNDQKRLAEKTLTEQQARKITKTINTLQEDLELFEQGCLPALQKWFLES